MKFLILYIFLYFVVEAVAGVLLFLGVNLLGRYCITSVFVLPLTFFSTNYQYNQPMAASSQSHLACSIALLRAQPHLDRIFFFLVVR